MQRAGGQIESSEKDCFTPVELMNHARGLNLAQIVDGYQYRIGIRRTNGAAQRIIDHGTTGCGDGHGCRSTHCCQADKALATRWDRDAIHPAERCGHLFVAIQRHGSYCTASSEHVASAAHVHRARINGYSDQTFSPLSYSAVVELGFGYGSQRLFGAKSEEDGCGGYRKGEEKFFDLHNRA